MRCMKSSPTRSACNRMSPGIRRRQRSLVAEALPSRLKAPGFRTKNCDRLPHTSVRGPFLGRYRFRSRAPLRHFAGIKGPVTDF